MNKIVSKSNVKLVTPEDAIIYACPVEDDLVVVAKKSRLKFEKENVISSAQAEGIFHKIEEVQYTGQYGYCIEPRNNCSQETNI